MKIYKISVKNHGLADKAAPLYFQEERTAHAVISTFDFLTKKEVEKLEWKCEAISVMSHDEAFKQFEELGKEIFKE